MSPEESILLVILFFMFVIVPFMVSLPVAVQAKRRGYSFLAWWIAGGLGNSILLLLLLGVLPDFSRLKRREHYRRLLEDRLAARQSEPPAVTLATPVDGIDRSLGDLPTELPQRSLGDEATRL